MQKWIACGAPQKVIIGAKDIQEAYKAYMQYAGEKWLFEKLPLQNLKKEDDDFGDTGAEEGMVRLFVNLGKKNNIRPGDILGAIAGETKMPGRLIGSIDIYDKYTFVEVPREYAAEVLDRMKNVKIRGKAVNIEPANRR